MRKSMAGLLALVSALSFSANAFAQAAGAGADFNNAERARMAREAARDAEGARQQQRDPPLRDDVLGNAITGGLATAAVRGPVQGAVSVGTRVAVGTGIESATDSSSSNDTQSESPE